MRTFLIDFPSMQREDNGYSRITLKREISSCLNLSARA